MSTRCQKYRKKFEYVTSEAFVCYERIECIEKKGREQGKGKVPSRHTTSEQRYYDVILTFWRRNNVMCMWAGMIE